MPERRPRTLIIAAPHSGSGKTIVSFGLAAALRAKGVDVAMAKTGPDYIDGSFHAEVVTSAPVNLDPWAMTGDRVRSMALAHAGDADLLLIEGVMGLFDGAADGTGSTADLATMLDAPVLLVIDASRQAQSVAALATGFARFRSDVQVAGIVLNRVASPRHESMLRTALENVDLPVVGAVPRALDLTVPSRHLGLVEAKDTQNVQAIVQAAMNLVGASCDLDAIMAAAAPLAKADSTPRLAPLGQHVAIARDRAFSFLYEHFLDDWRQQGAAISFFSPLAGGAIPSDADAVFLPGGYPELHGEALAHSPTIRNGLAGAAARGALIYGECGGYMVLGQALTDRKGKTFPMAGLMPHQSSMAAPRRTLGYRRLTHESGLPFAKNLRGHEFHYSVVTGEQGTQLFDAADATGIALAPMGRQIGRVMGSYAHVIDAGDRA